MARSNKETAASDEAEFSKSFNDEDAPKTEQSEDEAFGLGPEPVTPDAEGAATDTAGAASGSATPSGAAPAAAAAAPETPDSAKEEQRLRSWEGRLRAKEAELAEKEASLSTANTNEEQTSSEDGEGKDGEQAGEGATEGADDEADPAKALAEDFGTDFVAQLTKLIKHICAGEIGSGVGGVSAMVDQVINELKEERQQNHFHRIRAAHEDFMEVTATPEFAAWCEGLPPEEQAVCKRVTESGSAQEIIDLLTKFKASQATPDADDSSSDDTGDAGFSAEHDAAEGVRSSGMRLPVSPKSKDDYSDAWNEA